MVNTAQSLAGKKITVMGLGLHGGGLGTVEYLAGQGATVTVTDMKTAEQLAPSLEKLTHIPNLTFVLGRHRDEDFTAADMIVRNPSVPRQSKYLELARSHHIPVEMDSSLFFTYAPTSQIIGVTGSKGKTTTSAGIAVILKAAWPQAVAVGVDGISPLKELPVISPNTPVIFELSSWRLEALEEHKRSPHIAVVTSLYRDHLNTYASFADYIETKKTIIRYQTKEDIAVLNYDDPLIRQWRQEVQAQAYWYSLASLPADVNGIYIKDSTIWIRRQGADTELFPLTSLPLHFPHEQRNLLPGILVAHLLGMPAANIKEGVQLIHGLPYRLETVREKDGITYINDSAATMPDATIAALQALKGKSLVHIIGGSDKNLLFEELAQEVAQAAIRALIWLPGTATERMKETILAVNHTFPAYMVSSMQEAVIQASQLAQGGDVVLLSPGATSFGLFLHEFDRGDQFRQAVLAL